MAEARVGRAAGEVASDWRRLSFEQRIAAVGAVLLVVSTFGPFSFVEAAELLTGVGVLALLRARARGRDFHLPFGDGMVVTAAAVWAALLIVVRLFDRPLGQNLLALATTAILGFAGLREHAKRPLDDIPEAAVSEPEPEPRPKPEPAVAPRPRKPEPPRRASHTEDSPTRAISGGPSTPAAKAAAGDDETETEQLELTEVPEFEPEKPEQPEEEQKG